MDPVEHIPASYPTRARQCARRLSAQRGRPEEHAAAEAPLQTHNGYQVPGGFDHTGILSPTDPPDRIGLIRSGPVFMNRFAHTGPDRIGPHDRGWIRRTKMIGHTADLLHYQLIMEGAANVCIKSLLCAYLSKKQIARSPGGVPECNFGAFLVHFLTFC